MTSTIGPLTQRFIDAVTQRHATVRHYRQQPGPLSTAANDTLAALERVWQGDQSAAIVAWWDGSEDGPDAETRLRLMHLIDQTDAGLAELQARL